MALLPPPEARYPPKENDDPKKVAAPKAGTAWAVAIAGTDDVRCSHREAHLFNLFHALGISPDTPWPPDPVVELALREPQ